VRISFPPKKSLFLLPCLPVSREIAGSLPRLLRRSVRLLFFSGFITALREMWYFSWGWFVSATYPIVIKGRWVVLLALAKAQRALRLVEDVRRKLPTLGDTAAAVAQHFPHSLAFMLSVVTQWLIKYEAVFFIWSLFSFTKNFTTRKAVSQIYSLRSHSVIASVFPHPKRKLFNGKTLKREAKKVFNWKAILQLSS
jgi:hypothetical protein